MLPSSIFSRVRPSRRCLVATLLLLSAVPARALQPHTAEQLAQYRADGSLTGYLASARALGNHRANPALVTELQSTMLRLDLQAKGISADEIDKLVSPPPTGVRQGLRSKGTNRIFALVIEFPDYPATESVATIDAAMFGNGLASDAPYESVRNYYRRASYNQLEIQGVTLGYFRSANTRASIPRIPEGREALIREAVTHFDGLGHDFSQYDNDGDGVIDYFCVFWTGPTEDGVVFWWPSYIGGWASSFTIDGKQFAGSTFSWQDVINVRGNMTRFTPMAVIHETGHALGLPDLYDYDSTVGPGGGVGGLDMMGTGQGDLNSFSKMLLGWITPVVARDRTSYTLAPSGVSPQAIIIWPGYSPARPFTEFFMVQNRTRMGNDQAPNWPADGLLIWHVDARLSQWGDFLYDNSYTEHKLLRLMEADGLEEIEASPHANAGDAGDFYVRGRSFGPTTRPNSNAYDGSVTDVGVSAIAPSGTSITFVTTVRESVRRRAVRK